MLKTQPFKNQLPMCTGVSTKDSQPSYLGFETSKQTVYFYITLCTNMYLSHLMLKNAALKTPFRNTISNVHRGREQIIWSS